MKAYYENLRWEKGKVKFLRSSTTYYIPSNAIEGSNDTLIVPESAKLEFTIITENDEYITEDIIDIVKSVNGWKKLSQGRYDKLNKKLVNTPHFDVDSNGYIKNLVNLVKV